MGRFLVMAGSVAVLCAVIWYAVRLWERFASRRAKGRHLAHRERRDLIGQLQRCADLTTDLMVIDYLCLMIADLKNKDRA